jgi:hypothetical protein
MVGIEVSTHNLTPPIPVPRISQDTSEGSASLI